LDIDRFLKARPEFALQTREAVARSLSPLHPKEECGVFRELFEDGISRHVMKDLPMVILFALAFGPLLAVARDHILGFIVLDEILINRTVEACWDGIRR